jgi:hypothetical protein
MESKRINLSREEILKDFHLAQLSRQVAVMGRKEVLSGKAKFGIFGDGKEVAQIAMARNFRNGDWRSGYYRDHTFMMAAGMFTAEQFFYQLYGLTDEQLNPGTAGRNFNNHFASMSLREDGSWNDLAAMKNTSADLSPTAGQMPRLIGLGSQNYSGKMSRCTSIPNFPTKEMRLPSEPSVMQVPLRGCSSKPSMLLRSSKSLLHLRYGTMATGFP